MNSHGVVEELLELFVDKIDADLFKSIEFEDLKPWGGQFQKRYNCVDEELNNKNPPVERPAMSSTPMKLTFFIVGSIL